VGQPGTYAVTPRQPWTPYRRKQAKLVAAVIGGGILFAVADGTGLAALAIEKRAADEQAAAASKSADS
jgi:hypothetical protein